MRITYELLKEKRACADGLRWFAEKFPEGCELNDETIAKIKDCNSDFVWWFYNNVQPDQRLYSLVGVSWSNGVNKSNGVSWSNGVNKSNGVNGSDGVSWSNGVNKSDGVSWSNGVNGSDGVSWSNGVNWSFGIVNSFGVDHALFTANKPREYSIFGKPVSMERFREVWGELYNRLEDWRPRFNNIKALWLANGSNWRLTPVEGAEELSIKEAWSGMPRNAIEYLASLPEFDAAVFEAVTGIEIK